MKRGYFTKKISLTCILCILTLTACSCINIDGWSRFEYEKAENLASTLVPGSTFVLENDVGSIIIEGLDISECRVDAVMKAKAPTEQEAQQLAGQTKINLEQNGSTLIVRITKPPKKKDRSISIDFKIAVPKQTPLRISSDVGEIRISEITETIKVRTDVGEISCKQISGNIDLQSDVGKISVVYSKNAPAACNATISTDVGSIDLTVPPECSASVQANTDVGSISTDMPLTIKGTVGKSLHGTIGSGEGKINLKTDVGAIKIRK
ncbi:MAG: DUF4097 family beta strand repeat protein [Sedimentisphaerales bacterium]|nr:DUF4097 family beta strand repeat protein [Sedimentisphaerales bacterium]